MVAYGKINSRLSPEHDCLFAAGLTFCLQLVLMTVVQSLTAVAGNSVFFQHSIGGATLLFNNVY